ncbi:IAA-amino acid hydrolase ILR1 [Trifolium repens]|nr:IAA-amino acid hydrolase ILR1 [Trifolium repens]
MTSTGAMASIPGLFTAAGCFFEVIIVGGHVAFSQPTVDPLLTTLLTILAVQQLLSREIDPLHSQVLSITYVQVGCALNVFGKHVRLRSQTTASMHHFKQRLKEEHQVGPPSGRLLR